MTFLSRYKLLIYALSAIFVCGLLVIVAIYFFIKGNLYETEINNYKNAVFVKSEEIRVTLNSANYVSQSLQNDLVLKNYLKNTDKIIQNEEVLSHLKVYNIANVFSALYVMDLDGNTLVSTDKSFVGKNYSFRDYFIEAKDQSYSFDVVLGATSQELGYYFSGRIDDENGKPLGVVVAKLKSDIIEQKMDFVNKNQNTIIMLTDKYSVAVYSNKLERLFNSVFVLDDINKEKIIQGQRFQDKKNYHIFDLSINDFVKSNIVTLFTKNGKNVYYNQIGNYNLFLFVEELEITQLQNIINIVNITSFLILFGVVFASFIVFLIIKNYLKPIEMLYNAALVVSRGKYDYNISYNSKFEEMQELILAFNMMASSVKKIHDEVAEKVQIQTKKIVEKQEFLEEQKEALLNVLQDVKAEKERSDNLTKELEKFKFAVDNASDHILITDPDGITLFANKAVSKITGFNEKEVLGTKAGKLWGGIMDKDFYDTLWRVIKKNKKVFAGEILNKRKNGEIYPAEVSITPLLNKHKDVKFFLGIERDITVRKKDEEMLKEVLRDLKEQDYKLAEEKAKYEALLASISSGIIVTDEKGKIVLVNKAAEEMLGKNSVNMKDKSIYSEVLVFDEKGNVLNKEDRAIFKALKTGEQQVSLVGTPHYYKNKDGILFPIGFMVSPFVWMEKIIGSILVFRDISYEQSIDKAKTEFVSLASHQLRTPLSTINWYAEMLLDETAGKLTDDQKDYLLEISAGNKRMVDLVNSLLNVSRIELGTFAIDPEKLDIREVFDSVIKELEPNIKEKKMLVKTKYDKKIKKINLDPKLIRMVVQNLLSNAVKYTPEKGKIMVNISNNDQELLISVADNGYGIPKDQQKNIFGKMFRADNVKLKDTTGTGLGLYIVKSIIEQSADGKIWFESKENKGTTFYFTLPLKGMVKKEGSKALN
ncbi:MAG: PAS domain S-box protein [Candidatus Magasanikbacteria bacterium]